MRRVLRTGKDGGMTDDSQQASWAVDTVLFDVDGTLIDSTYHLALIHI